MKQEILNRIKLLGGDISEVYDISLEEDLKAITFWSKAHLAEPIYGMNDFVEQNKALLDSDKTEFYKAVISHFYRDTEEGFGQVFFKNELFTPFKPGTESYEEWNGEWEESEFKKVIDGTEMELMFIGHSYGFPDNLFVCLTDPNPENPTVYGTDHEVFFSEITKEGTMEEYFNSFMTKDELLKIIKDKFE